MSNFFLSFPIFRFFYSKNGDIHKCRQLCKEKENGKTTKISIYDGMYYCVLSDDSKTTGVFPISVLSLCESDNCRPKIFAFWLCGFWSPDSGKVISFSIELSSDKSLAKLSLHIDHLMISNSNRWTWLKNQQGPDITHNILPVSSFFDQHRQLPLLYNECHGSKNKTVVGNAPNFITRDLWMFPMKWRPT